MRSRRAPLVPSGSPAPGLSCLQSCCWHVISGQGLRREPTGKSEGGKHPEAEEAEKGHKQPTTAEGEDYTPVRHARRGREGEGEEEGASSGAFTCHVRLAGPQGLKNQLQLPDSCGRLFSTGHVRLQDHFQKANPYQRKAESA